jgi:hypothetical protein
LLLLSSRWCSIRCRWTFLAHYRLVWRCRCEGRHMSRILRGISLNTPPSLHVHRTHPDKYLYKSLNNNTAWMDSSEKNNPLYTASHRQTSPGCYTATYPCTSSGHPLRNT